jgi:hypothetical protein
MMRDSVGPIATLLPVLHRVEIESEARRELALGET